MFDVPYYEPNTFASGWSIASIILAVVGGILVLLLFLNKSNKGKYNKKLLKLYDFLNFDFLTLAITIYVLLNSFNYISYNFLSFLLYLVFGLIFTRVSFEMLMILIKICNNTSEINEKLGKEEKETKKK